MVSWKSLAPVAAMLKAVKASKVGRRLGKRSKRFEGRFKI
jgi:hypothetical protein